MATSNIGPQAGLNENMNFDDVYIRCVTAALMSTLRDRIYWINRFDTGDVKYTVPFIFKMVGQERFLRDLFEDDTPNKRVELNTDPVPRAVLSYKSFTIKLSETSNPYVRSPHTIKENNQKKQATSINRSIPVRLTYSLDAKFQSEIDVFKFVQKTAEVFFYWNFFNFDYNGMKIDAVFFYPESPGTDTPKEMKIDSVDNYTVSVELNVDSFMPVLTDTRFYNTGRIKTWDMSILESRGITGLVTPLE